MTCNATSFFVNARFLTRAGSGVDRVAINLIVALAENPDVDRLTLLHPMCDYLNRGWIDELPAETRAKISIKALGKNRGYFWEQIDLARTMPEQLLLSFCSTGPALRRLQAVMIHDAQVWDVPESYSFGFRLAYRLLLPVLAHRARHVFTVSHFSAKRLVDLGIAPGGKPQVILNGADHVLHVKPDPQALDRYRLVPDNYILAIGSIAPHKNLALLVKAAAARGPGAPELIVAGGIYTKVFSNAELQAANGVRFIGRVTDGELRTLYENALALAFPSLTEGFGLPPLEAMLCGCPVIATTGGAVPEICGDAALFVDPIDQVGWTAAMERLARDPTLRENLSRKGLTQGAQFTWKKAGEELLTILRT